MDKLSNFPHSQKLTETHTGHPGVKAQTIVFKERVWLPAVTRANESP